MPPICTDCVYATPLYPDDAAKFYKCGNPAYATVSLVDGSKTYYTCELVRAWRFRCGPCGKGFLAHTPKFKTPATPRWKLECIEIKHLWQQRANLIKPSYWKYMHSHGKITIVGRLVSRLFYALDRIFHGRPP